MKKINVSFLVFSVCLSVHAQTLNQSTHAPAVGDVYTFQYADQTTLPGNLGNPGTGNTFNFSGLSVYPGSSTSQGVTVASTGSASAYPSANVAVQTGTDNTFYNAQSSQLQFYGGNLTLGGYPVTLNYSTPAVLGIYPMSLGTTNTNTVAGTINALGNNGNFIGTSSFTANATGTLVVPGGQSYANVIRMQSNQNMTFTVSFVQGTLTVNQYDYYAPNYSNYPNVNNNWPLLTVQQSTLSSTIGGPSVQTTVTINSNYQTLGTSPISNSTFASSFIAPNPAQDVVYVSFVKHLKSVQILDITGKILYETNTDRIYTELLANGVYFVRWEDARGNVKTEKLIVQHN